MYIYLFTCLGWESRWDEWVSRSRFRWLVDQDAVEPIREGDPVELWCCGVNVPGAWLESRVDRVTSDGQYELSKVSVSGQSIKVPRSRIRLASHKKRPLSKPPMNTNIHLYKGPHVCVNKNISGEITTVNDARAMSEYQYQHNRRLSVRLEQQQHGYNGGVDVSDMHPRERDPYNTGDAHNSTKACTIM